MRTSLRQSTLLLLRRKSRPWWQPKGEPTVLDLSTLDTTKAAEEGCILEIRHPTSGAVLSNGDGRAVTLTLAGMDSQRAKKAERFATNRRLKMGGRRSY